MGLEKETKNEIIKYFRSNLDVIISDMAADTTGNKTLDSIRTNNLCADVINFSSSSSSIKKGETLIDTVNNILAMKVNMIVLRHPNPGSALLLSKNVNSCIINAGDGTNEHPTQALLDTYSIKQK